MQEGQGDEQHPGHAGVADVLRGCFRTDGIKAAIGMLFQVQRNDEHGMLKLLVGNCTSFQFLDHSGYALESG